MTFSTRATRVLVAAVTSVLVLPISMLATGTAARADVPDTVTAFIQPMSGCLTGPNGAMYCQGTLGAPIAISPDPATNAAIWPDTGYALCWTTTSGTTVPASAACSTTGTAIASGNYFSYSNVSQFPFSVDGSGGSGCTAYPNNNGNSFFILVPATGPCVITVTTSASTGYTSTTSVYSLTSAEAPAPTLTGSLSAASGGFRAGQSSLLQTITCRYDIAIGAMYAACPGVTLNWAVVTGKRSCAITVNQNKKSQQLGSVSVTFRRPGTCTVQGSYGAVPGLSSAYTTPTYTYTVKRGR